MPNKPYRYRRGVVTFVVLAGVAAAVSYGVAQNTVVTQAEWAVYMVRALRLDWNLPPHPKSNDYIERLNWQSGIEFAATGVQPGSSPALRVEAGYIESEGLTAEALYRISTIRPGDYGFRLKLAKGGAVVKIGGGLFEAYQPREEFRWVDLDRVALDPGDHTLNVLLTDGARTESVGVVPPCLIAVEPHRGWDALKPLTFGDLAVTLAKALELEHGLAAIGSEITIKGEDFTRIMEIPMEEEAGEESQEPFWLSSGGSLVSARTSFAAPEAGLYTLEARYFSPKEVRWVVDGCLRAITCPMRPGAGVAWTTIVALQLDAGVHDLDVTLPPHASLDQLAIQQRDGRLDEYMAVASDEGFKMRDPADKVSRRRAIAAAVRLRSLFERWKASRCKDTLVALEQIGALILAAKTEGSTTAEKSSAATRSKVPPASPGAALEPTDPGNPIFPTSGGQPPVGSPIKPGENQ